MSSNFLYIQFVQQLDKLKITKNISDLHGYTLVNFTVKIDFNKKQEIYMNTGGKVYYYMY